MPHLSLNNSGKFYKQFHSFLLPTAALAVVDHAHHVHHTRLHYISRCEEDVIQHMDLFLVPRLQSFYEGREASTREDHLPRGKRRMNEINGLPNLLSCSHNRTLFKIGLLHSLKVVVLLTKRGHTTSSSPNNRVALDDSI